MKTEEKKEELRFYPTEKIEIIRIKRNKKGFRYAVTNYGRVIRFKTTPKEGEFMKLGTLSSKHPYPCVYYDRMRKLVHQLVALYFLPKPVRDQIFVIHKDQNKNNNHVSNLKWVNKQEHVEHAMKSEGWKNAKRSNTRYKLTEDRVRLIRKKLKEGKTRMRIIAKQFGITDMQLYRIKSGENWGWVK